MIRTMTRFAFAPLVALAIASPAFAQDNDATLKPAEPDFTVINIPTSLRLPQWGSEFRITHRFGRPLKCDQCESSLLGDAFGIDEGAVIGLEYRIGLIPNGQVVVHRTRMDKSIQFLGEYGLTRQKDSMPFESAVLVSVEGTNNFQDEYSPAVGLTLSRLFGDVAAIHVDPIWVGNSNIDPTSTSTDDNTFMIGIGGRLQLHDSIYVSAEISPRVSGYKPDTNLAGFAFEKRIGGHMFSITFTNYFGTTLRQIAQGAKNNSDWYLGFNITRKFF